MKVTLCMVALLLALPAARADEEKELADRLKKVEQRLADLEQRLAAEEAKKQRDAARARRAAALRGIEQARVDVLQRLRVAQVAQAQANNIDVMLKKAAAGDMEAMKYLEKLRARIDKVLKRRGMVFGNWGGTIVIKPAARRAIQVQVARPANKELEAKVDAARQRVVEQSGILKAMIEKEERK